MADEFYGKGITVASGFDLSAKSPLDTRNIANTIEERDAHVLGNRAYEGMKVYVLADKKEYRYNGTYWEEVGGITDEQLNQLTIAYEHSQSTHVTQEDLQGLATETYVNTKIAEASLGGEVDLSNYATKDDLDTKVDKEEGKSLIADTEIERLANLTNYDDTELINSLNILNDNIDSLETEIPTKTSELINDSGFLTSIPSEYITEDELVSKDYVTSTELDAKGYLTEHQDISNLATNDYVNEMLGGKKLIYLTQADYDILSDEEKNDDTVVYNITDAVDDYVTNEELEAKGYLTEHQDISGKVDKEEGKSLIADVEIERLANVTNYDDTEIRNELNTKANTSDLHEHPNKEILDGITAEKITSWDNKSDFDGDYNNLTNRPTIPTKTSELENDSTYVTESGVLEIIENSGGIGGATEVSQGETEPTEDNILLWIDTASDEDMVENNLSDALLSEFRESISNLNTRVTTLEEEAETVFGEDAHNHSNKEVLDKITQAYFDKWTNKSDFSGSYNDLTDKPNLDQYATTSYVDTAISNVNVGDLTDYALKSELPTKTSELTKDSGYLTSIPSEYVTETELDAKGYVTSTELDGKGYLTEHQDISNLATKDELNTKANSSDIPTQVSELTNDSGYLTSIPSEYITESELTSMGYATETYVQNKISEIGSSGGSDVNLDDYQTKSDDTLETTDKTVIGAINEINTALDKYLPFEDSYVSDCNTWLTNGYTKTNTTTTNHPSVCTGTDKWGIIFFIAENVTNGTGTQMYFPIDGTYKGAVFTRFITNGSAGDWTKLATNDDITTYVSNNVNIPTSLPADGGNADTVDNFHLWKGTQSEYDAISSKDSNTIYIIVG